MFRSFILVAIVIVVAALSAPSIEPFLLSATASLVDKSTSQSVSSQSTTDTQTLNVVDKVETSDAGKVAAPIIGESAVSKSADQGLTESQSDILFRQFQTWEAAQKDNLTPVKDVPARVLQDIPKRSTLQQKRRNFHPVVRSQDVAKRSTRKSPQPVRSAQAQVPASLNAESQWSPRSQ